ncbi:MAG TPA: hypothetical protein VLJ83_01025 [Gemmatimonadaceae bacterium]|nr:hypothetical protein [Gemmatimonadaceae bacterium]
MTANSNPDHAAEVTALPSEGVAYPKDHVVGVIRDHARMTEAVDALIAAGFEPSEIKVIAGPAAADRLAMRDMVRQRFTRYGMNQFPATLYC